MSGTKVRMQVGLSAKRWVTLMVGGELLETTEKTLTKFPNSKLAKMVTSYTETGPYQTHHPLFLDINPVYFRAVLDWLR